MSYYNIRTYSTLTFALRVTGGARGKVLKNLKGKSSGSETDSKAKKNKIIQAEALVVSMMEVLNIAQKIEVSSYLKENLPEMIGKLSFKQCEEMTRGFEAQNLTPERFGIIVLTATHTSFQKALEAAQNAKNFKEVMLEAFKLNFTRFFHGGINHDYKAFIEQVRVQGLIMAKHERNVEMVQSLEGLNINSA